MFHTHSFIFSLSSLPPAKKEKEKKKNSPTVCVCCVVFRYLLKKEKNKKTSIREQHTAVQVSRPEKGHPMQLDNTHTVCLVDVSCVGSSQKKFLVSLVGFQFFRWWQFLILSLANLTFFLNKKLRHSVALVIWKGVTFFLIKKTLGKS
jgi:hypothetical protein